MTEDEIKSELKRIFGDGWVKYYPQGIIEFSKFKNPQETNCANCRFFEAFKLFTVPPQEIGCGLCKRRCRNEWREVGKQDWCGDWEERLHF